MSDPTYKRRQVEQALWSFFAAGRRAAAAPPLVFRNRIKRLLEIDRLGVPYASETSPADFAFFDEAPVGTGTDTRYSVFNAFCLALALDCLDAGFKQAEVVFLMRDLRMALEPWFALALRHPPSPQQRQLALHYPGCPSFAEDGGRFVDLRLFVVIGKIELTEHLSPAAQAQLADRPVYLEPDFCRGGEALGQALRRLDYAHRKVFVLELAYAAAGVAQLLAEAPPVHRGRP
jgi:hypothetical protein